MARAVRYRVLNKIAHGGMAEIFLALQTGVEGFQKPVVLKRILPGLAADPSFVGMLVDEAHIASTLNHSNLVQVLDLGKSGDQYFLVLEFVDGWSLEQVRRRAQKLRMKMPLPLALYVVGSLCRALAYVHTRKRDGKPLGIVHRDVNAQNVLLSREGEVKLADFGIAKAIGKREKSATGVIKGKFAYMSPEQSIGAELNAQSDLFSVGTLLYILTTGKKPFEGATDLDVLMQVRKARYEKPSVLVKDFNPDVERFIARAMRADLGRRWQSAEQMADRIDAILVKLGQPSGAAVLKRWLDNLAARDGVKPPAEALESGAATSTIELGSRDLELEEVEAGPVHDDDPAAAPRPIPWSRPNPDADEAGSRWAASAESAARPGMTSELDDSESKSIQILRPKTAVEQLLSAEEAGAEIIHSQPGWRREPVRRAEAAAMQAARAEAAPAEPARSEAARSAPAVAEPPLAADTLPDPKPVEPPRPEPARPERLRNGKAAAAPVASAVVPTTKAASGSSAAMTAALSPSMVAAAAATTPMPPRARSFVARVGRLLRRLVMATLLLAVLLGVGGYYARSYLPAWLVRPVEAWLQRLPPPVGVGEFNQ
jgi:serine/threonine protein kinase